MVDKTMANGKHVTGPDPEQVAAVEAKRLRAEAQKKLEKAEILESGGLDTLTVYLPKSLKEELRLYAHQLQLTMKDVVIFAIRRHLGYDD